jgi:hypothetical protein
MALSPTDPKAYGVASGLTQQNLAQTNRAATEAWRYRLDQETRSALNAFRALAQPNKAQTSAVGPDNKAVRQTAAALPATTAQARSTGAQRAGPNAGLAAPPGASRLLPWQAARAYASVAAGPGAWASATNATTRAAAGSSAIHDTAAALQAHLASTGSQWPWRKLHLVLEEDGVRAWLRDSGMADGSRELSAMLQQLQEALSGLGLRLRGFTLNGKPLALA